MINLLPPDVKTEIAYSKRNSALLRLIVTVAAAGASVTTILNLGAANLDKDLQTAKQELAAGQKSLSDPTTINSLKDVGQKLTAISQINASKHHYSAFLRDFSGHLPDGSWIDKITLTGDGKPYQFAVRAQSQAVAGQVKDSLAKSSRVQSVDLQAITQEGSTYTVSITVNFKPGMDR